MVVDVNERYQPARDPMAQELRALVNLEQDPGSIPNTYTVDYNLLRLQFSDTLFCPSWALYSLKAKAYMQANMHTHVIK